MKKESKLIIALAFFASILILQEGCKKEEIELGFNEFVHEMSLPKQATESDEVVLEEYEESGGNNIICTVQKIYAAPGSDEFLLYDPTSDILWPGSLLKLESIEQGSFTPIIADRKPMTISISLESINGTPKCLMDNPALSNARECINDILGQGVSGATPARLAFSIEEIHSAEQSKLALGVSIGGLWGKVKSSYDFNDQAKRTFYLVKFLQVYYTVDIDIPASPSDWFSEIPPTNTLGSYSPVYISSIKYGRMLYFMVQSSKSYSEVRAALEASFGGWVIEGGINISNEHKNTIQNSTIKGLAIGGPSSGTVGLVNGVTGLKEYLSSGANYNSNSPGVPVAFTLRFLKDNSVARIVLATEYVRRICEYISPGNQIVEFFPNYGNYYETGGSLGPVNWINGDRDFKGHGPRVNMKVTLTKSDRYLNASFHFIFKETIPDFTTGETLKTLRVYTAPLGWKINKILSNDHFEKVYIDNNGHQPEALNFNPIELVQTIVVNGDNNGPDLPGEYVNQNRSWFQVKLNRVRLELVKN